MSKKTLFINVSEEKHQELKEYAVRNKTDLSKLVREAIDFYISNRGDQDGLGRETKETD